MRWDDVYVAGTGAHLPDRVEVVEDAIAAGRCTEQDRRTTGIRSVTVAAPDETGPVMAAAAARDAVDDAAGHGVSPVEIGLVLHAYVGHQGQDVWTPANFVQQESIGGDAPAAEVVQGSNGGLMALDLAASHLVARAGTAALVTTGDAFHLPWFDRWATDRSQPHGDAGAAVVLSRRGGTARLLSTASRSDPSLEVLMRGRCWTSGPFADGTTLDLAARQHEYLLSAPDLSFEEVGERIGRLAADVLDEALKDADAELADARFVVHPTIARSVVQFSYYDGLGIDPATTTFEWGLGRGHLGAGDHLVGIDHVVRDLGPRPGDLLVAIGVGTGFVATAAVLRFTGEGAR